MKNLNIFRLRDLSVAVALIACPLLATAQDGPGGKPEMMEIHSAKPKVASTTLKVTLGDKTLTLLPADLAALPHETVTAINGHTKTSETYSGVPIAALLDKLGLPFIKANEHTLLRTYVIADGTDGYRSIVSTYETLATIRGTSVIVADTLG